MAQMKTQVQKRKATPLILDEECSPAKMQPTPTEGILEAKKIMKEVEKKIENSDSKPTDFLEYFRSLTKQMETVTKKTKVGVFGKTGVGKSYLINTILGEKLLPSGSGSACTSVIIQIEANTEDSKFTAEIELISKEEWQEELNYLFHILHEDITVGDDNDDDSVSAREKIKAVYGEEGLKKAITELSLDDTISKLLSKKTDVESAKAEELKEKISCFVRSYKKSHSTQRFYWPLVKSITIKVPGHNDILQNLVLMDLPGTGDTNKSRREMGKKCRKECSTVWILSDINRGIADKDSWDILKDVTHGGDCNNIAFICTKTDEMDTEDYMSENKLTDRDLGITEAEPAERENLRIRECIIHRNKTSKETITNDFTYLNIQEHFNSEDFQVFTVSARSYQRQLTVLTESLTEIPDLRKALKELNDSFPERRELEYITESEGVLSLIQGSNLDSPTYISTCEKKHQAYLKVREQLNEQLTTLQGSLEKSYINFARALLQSMEESEKSCETDAEEKVISPPELPTGKGHHKVLRALCVKGGATTSKKRKTTDLNAVLRARMQDKLDKAFTKLHFPRNTRQSWPMAAPLHEFSVTTNIDKKFRHPIDLIVKFIETQQDKRKTILGNYLLATKKEIYNCLRDTIESTMLPVYKKAASETEKGSYGRMQNVLREGIKEIKSTIFKRARLEILEKFVNMMDHFEKTLRELQNIAADALSLRHSVPLPDITEEVERMKRLKDERQRHI